jgi:hypothetical protein
MAGLDSGARACGVRQTDKGLAYEVGAVHDFFWHRRHRARRGGQLVDVAILVGLRRGGQLLGLDPAPLSGPLGAIRGGPALGANDHVLAIRIRGRVGSRRRRRHRELGAWLPRASLHKPAIAVIGDSFQGEPVRGLWVLLASEVKERGRWMGSGCYWRSPFSRRAAGYAGWLNGP